MHASRTDCGVTLAPDPDTFRVSSVSDTEINIEECKTLKTFNTERIIKQCKEASSVRVEGA